MKDLNPVACRKRAEAGCVVLVTPIAVDVIGAVSRAVPKGWVVDGVLSEICGAFVMGSREDCNRAHQVVAA